MVARIFALVLICLIAVLSYQAEPVSGTLGWVVVAFLTFAFLADFVRSRE
jgi:hypothetical protein